MSTQSPDCDLFTAITSRLRGSDSAMLRYAADLKTTIINAPTYFCIMGWVKIISRLQCSTYTLPIHNKVFLFIIIGHHISFENVDN